MKIKFKKQINFIFIISNVGFSKVTLEHDISKIFIFYLFCSLLLNIHSNLSNSINQLHTILLLYLQSIVDHYPRYYQVFAFFIKLFIIYLYDHFHQEDLSLSLHQTFLVLVMLYLLIINYQQLLQLKYFNFDQIHLFKLIID